MKKTEAQKQYQKELNRIKRLVTRAAKRGYIFPRSIIPEKPKRVNIKSVEKLQKLTPDVLYSKAKYYDPLIGKFIKGTERRKQERSTSAKKAAVTRARKRYYGDTIEHYSPVPVDANTNIISALYEKLNQWSASSHWSSKFTDVKTRDKNTLKKILDGAIADLGMEKAAENAQNHAQILNELFDEILYGSGSVEGNFRDSNTIVNRDITTVAQILRGRSLTVDEAKELNDIEPEHEDYIDGYTVDSL